MKTKNISLALSFALISSLASADPQACKFAFLTRNQALSLFLDSQLAEMKAEVEKSNELFRKQDVDLQTEQLLQKIQDHKTFVNSGFSLSVARILIEADVNGTADSALTNYEQIRARVKALRTEAEQTSTDFNTVATAANAREQQPVDNFEAVTSALLETLGKALPGLPGSEIPTPQQKDQEIVKLCDTKGSVCRAAITQLNQYMDESETKILQEADSVTNDVNLQIRILRKVQDKLQSTAWLQIRSGSKQVVAVAREEVAKALLKLETVSLARAQLLARIELTRKQYQTQLMIVDTQTAKITTEYQNKYAVSSAISGTLEAILEDRDVTPALRQQLDAAQKAGAARAGDVDFVQALLSLGGNVADLFISK